MGLHGALGGPSVAAASRIRIVAVWVAARRRGKRIWPTGRTTLTVLVVANAWSLVVGKGCIRVDGDHLLDGLVVGVLDDVDVHARRFAGARQRRTERDGLASLSRTASARAVEARHGSGPVHPCTR